MSERPHLDQSGLRAAADALTQDSSNPAWTATKATEVVAAYLASPEVHNPLNCGQCHADGTAAEIAHYRKALEGIRAYFEGGWPETDDCARIWKLAEEALK